jgi:hypothetical protein
MNMTYEYGQELVAFEIMNTYDIRSSLANIMTHHWTDHYGNLWEDL